jgi:hypothetical protein
MMILLQYWLNIIVFPEQSQICRFAIQLWCVIIKTLSIDSKVNELTLNENRI